MDQLKLAAFDSDDLAVVSAHVQDAVLNVGALRWRAADNRFVVVLNRFVWEKASSGRRKRDERHRAVLDFAHVTAARAQNLRRDAPDAVLSLLAVTFDEGEAPAGRITLHFSGGGAMQLDVDCIEVTLTDLGAAWAAQGRPEHDLDD
ncbi:DUF2948 family protein [Amorphus coralli]|uniref:DUF2948 family protein n=1 Tax=Amorphus coralli TaxID=340680 RepID=UPI0003662D10|nr:DUF2948 family protein [Amorphus coralli]